MSFSHASGTLHWRALLVESEHEKQRREMVDVLLHHVVPCGGVGLAAGVVCAAVGFGTSVPFLSWTLVAVGVTTVVVGHDVLCAATQLAQLVEANLSERKADAAALVARVTQSTWVAKMGSPYLVHWLNKSH